MPLAPEGSPPKLSEILPLKPFTAVVETVNFALPPAVTPTDSGVTEILKSGVAAFITSVVVVFFTIDPLVPVIVKVWLPAGVEPLVETDNVADPVPLMDGGVKVAEAPLGKPATFSAIELLKPFNAFVDIE